MYLVILSLIGLNLDFAESSSEEFVTTFKFDVKEEFFQGQGVVEDLYLQLYHFTSWNNSDESKFNVAIKDLSGCLRYKVALFTRQNIFSIGGQVGLILYGDLNGVLRIDGANYIFKEPDYVIQYNHFCFTFDSAKNNSLFMVQNGKLLYDDLVGLPDLSLTVTQMEEAGLTIGFNPYSLESKHLRRNLYHGYITEFYIWSKPLSVDFMINVTRDCIHAKSMFGGHPADIFDNDVYDWSKVQRNGGHVKLTQELMDRQGDDMCRQRHGKESWKIRLFQVETTYEKANMICQSLGGKVWYPENEPDFKDVIKGFGRYKANPAKNICDLQSWMGIVKNVNDSNGSAVFLNNGGQEQSFFNWAKGQPNGRDGEKCMIMMGDPEDEQSWKFYDWPCHDKFCFVCVIASDVTFRLRGSVQSNQSCLVDRNLAFRKDKVNAMHYFSGYRFTKIKWNQTMSQWQMRDTFDPRRVMGRIMTGQESYLTGLKTWDLNCSGEWIQTPLKLTHCQDDQFTCSTYGECLPVAKRCNGRVDCQFDISDEEDCEIVNINVRTYQKRQTPHENMKLSIGLNISSILDLKELESVYTVQLLLYMTWYDRRLSFKNLRTRRESNIVPEATMQQLWLPELVFFNTYEALRTKVDDTTLLTVDRQSVGAINDLEDLNEDLMYNGSSSPFIMSRLYTIEFQCTFQLAMFPFDKQKCPIILMVSPAG